MATTTSSTTTTTTTTEAPPTMRRRPVRPLRPIRRPLKRRPIDDYYYDQEYDDDYYEETINRRRPPSRMRPKQPLLDYDDEIPNIGRRGTNKRNRYRDELKEEAEEEEEYDIKPQSKMSERRKLVGRQQVDERRSFTDDRFSKNRRRQQSIVDLDPSEVRDDKPQTSPRPAEDLITPKAAVQSVYARPRVPPRIPRPVPVNEKNKYQYPIKKSGQQPEPESEPEHEPETEEQPIEDEYYDEETYVTRSRRRRIQDKRYRNEAQLPRQPNSRVRNQLRKPVVTEQDYESVEQDFAPISSSRRPTGRRRSSLIAKQPPEDVDFEDLDYYANSGKKHQQQQQQKPKVGIIHRAGEGRKKLRRPIIEKEEVEDVDTLDAAEEDPIAYETDDSSLEPEQGRSAVKSPYTPVRVIKRPFLPSRGGSPYLPRGLQAVGQAPKWLGSLHQQRPRESVEVAAGPNLSSIRMLEHGALVLRHTELTSQAAVTSAPRRHLPLSMPTTKQQQQHRHITNTQDEEFDDDNNEYNSSQQDEQESNRPQSQSQTQNQFQTQSQSQSQSQQHQQQTNLNAQVTLDMLYENDYDVTINDALNPTLKPLSQHHDHGNYASNANYASSSAYSSANSSKKIHNIKNASPSTSSASVSYSSSASSAAGAAAPAIGTSNNHIVRQKYTNINNNNHNNHPNNNHNNNYKSDSNFSSTDLRRRAIIKTSSNTQASESFASTIKSIIAEDEPIYDDEFEY